MVKRDIRKTQTARVDGLSSKTLRERVQMTMTNIQLNDIRENFESKYGKKGSAFQTVWNRITHIAGNSFLTMNDEELQQFFITEVIYDEMETSTKNIYKFAYKKIVSYLKNNGYINADFRKWKHQTKLVHVPRNKDSKMVDNIADKLHKKRSQLKESINSIEQEIKKHEQLKEQEIKKHDQRIKELKEQGSKKRGELAKLDSLQDEIIIALFS